jgi:hypothetical protein
VEGFGAEVRTVVVATLELVTNWVTTLEVEPLKLVEVPG